MQIKRLFFYAAFLSANGSKEEKCSNENRRYKDFSDSQIDTIEILLSTLYARFGITDSTDYSRLKPTDYPIMEDFYKLCEEEFYSYDILPPQLNTAISMAHSFYTVLKLTETGLQQ